MFGNIQEIIMNNISLLLFTYITVLTITGVVYINKKLRKKLNIKKKRKKVRRSEKTTTKL